MKLYVAGNVTKGFSVQDHLAGTRNRLLSYAFIKDWAKDGFEFWIERKPEHVSVFLDSGAFSAYTLGRTIDLNEYCTYVEQHRQALSAYAVLDVIGDEHGTRRNLSAMRARGLDPLPIYHVGLAPIQVLDELLADLGPSRALALGGMAAERVTNDVKKTKLDQCWSHIEKQWPVRVHGLGVTAQWALERYPFYSVDSSSAIVGAGMGRVMRIAGYAPFSAGDGLMTTNDWRDDVRLTLDGYVADGISHRRSLTSKCGTAHEGRRVRNIQAQLALERQMTALWAKRGVAWPS